MTGRKTSHDGTFSAEIRKCPECGHAFIPKRKDQRYCSPACRKKASRKRVSGYSGNTNRKRPKKKRRSLNPPVKDGLDEEAFNEMMDPNGTYEEMLQLSIRKLRKAVADPKTLVTMLPSLTKQLLDASKQLEALQETKGPGIDVLVGDMEKETDDDDESYDPEAI